MRVHELAVAYLRMRRDLLLGAYGSPAEDYRADWDRTEQEWRDAGCPIELPLDFPAPAVSPACPPDTGTKND